MNWSRICSVLKPSPKESPKPELELKIGRPVYIRTPGDEKGLYKARVISFDKDTVCVLHLRGQTYEFVPNDKDHILLELPKALPSERMVAA